MFQNQLSRVCVGLLGASLVASVSARFAQASTYSLNFSGSQGSPTAIASQFLNNATNNSAPTGSYTGLLDRLPGTGSSQNAGSGGSDQNMNLITASNLQIGANNADFNGQSNMNIAEAAGINLSRLGYTGSQNFSVQASFIYPTNAGNNFNQFGVYVGNDSTTLTRDGFVNVNGTMAYGTNTFGGGDNSGNLQGEPFAVGDNIVATISRTSGVFSETVADTTQGWSVNVNPTAAPGGFLNGYADLNVGVYATAPGGNTFSAIVTSFSATVVTPEPGSVAAFIGLGLCGLVAIARRRRAG